MTLPFLQNVAEASPTSKFVIHTLFPSLALPNHVYLGLDLSTQQLKCTVINDAHRVLYEDAINFDRDLPEFGTSGGVVRGNESEVVTAPTLMWVKALDMLMNKMRSQYGFDFGRVKGIAGAGQQHGSVYWARGASSILSSLDPAEPLHTQLSGAFAVAQSPTWQDASTAAQCDALEEGVGGPEALAEITGSKAYERFTGSQIMKIYQSDPDVYAATERISLVSSFLATLLLGRYAPIDAADGSGMNLMDVRTRRWDPRLLELCGGPELRDKLGEEPVDGGATLGNISEYWRKKWGFNEDCIIASFTGDNPATLASMNLLPGDCVVSLGTSDTVLLYLPTAHPTTDSHLLAHPTDSSAYMAMLCYRNGSLTRERVRDDYAEGSWQKFGNAVRRVPAGCKDEKGSRVVFYWVEQEIIPKAKGVYRFEGGERVDEFSGLEYGAKDLNIRAVVESQFMSMKIRTTRLLGVSTSARKPLNDGDDDPDSSPHLRRLLAAGGAASNPALLQLLADIFGLPVHIMGEGNNSAGFGAALLARFAVLRQRGEAETFDEMIVGAEKRKKKDGGHLLVASPQPEVVKVYEGLTEEFVRLEEMVVARQGEEEKKEEKKKEKREEKREEKKEGEIEKQEKDERKDGDEV